MVVPFAIYLEQLKGLVQLPHICENDDFEKTRLK